MRKQYAALERAIPLTLEVKIVAFVTQLLIAHRQQLVGRHRIGTGTETSPCRKHQNEYSKQVGDSWVGCDAVFGHDSHLVTVAWLYSV